jgi:ATP-dependent RNA helicase RhlE
VKEYTLTEFKTLGLAKPLLRAVEAEGYTNATPIQAQVIPAMLRGNDILGTAQTGTGKTAAFVLPLLDAIANGSKKPQSKRCTALILAPTRELAAQIADSINTYGQFVRHSAAVVVGGVRPGPQINKMAKGLDILVATPGRLLDHMGTGAVSLADTKTIVLDEADQMMDLGFMPAIRRIMSKLPKDRQNVLLSATMPKQIRALADDFLNNPTEVAIGAVARPIDKIDQKVILADKPEKTRALINLLNNNEFERAIVFSRTKHGADRIARQLSNAGLPAAAIHGNKSQGQRTRALDAFKEGTAPVLVATDIAARGIDVDGVSHVINFDLPNVPESYVHRIGRTARAGASGIAVSLCSGEERGLLKDIERLIGRKIPTEHLDGEAVILDFPSGKKQTEKPQDAKPKRQRSKKKKQHRGHKQASGQQSNRSKDTEKSTDTAKTAKSTNKSRNRRRNKRRSGGGNGGNEPVMRSNRAA